MLSRFGINNGEIIPVCVMATMSSGKSTFLNAILGEEILRSKKRSLYSKSIGCSESAGYS